MSWWYGIFVDFIVMEIHGAMHESRSSKSWWRSIRGFFVSNCAGLAWTRWNVGPQNDWGHGWLRNRRNPKTLWWNTAWTNELAKLKCQSLICFHRCYSYFICSSQNKIPWWCEHEVWIDGLTQVPNLPYGLWTEDRFLAPAHPCFVLSIPKLPLVGASCYVLRNPQTVNINLVNLVMDPIHPHPVKLSPFWGQESWCSPGFALQQWRPHGQNPRRNPSLQGDLRFGYGGHMISFFLYVHASCMHGYDQWLFQVPK